MTYSSEASTSEAKCADPNLDDSLAADLRRLVSSSELHRLCASATADRPAQAVASDKESDIVSWGIGTETQQALATRTSSFAHFNLTPEDVRQWRLEQERLESFAAESRRLSRSAAAPAESVGRPLAPWRPIETRTHQADALLAFRGQIGAPIYTQLQGDLCCATTPLENAGAHHLATFAGLSSHQQRSQAAPIPIESAANDLALQVANLRNPLRLRAIRHCLEDSQMSHAGPIAQLPPSQLATPAPQHAHDLSKPAHRRHNHRADQKRVLREWFDKHALDPYPSNEEKVELARKACMDVKQVENWFTNRRKRNWRHVKEDGEPAAQFEHPVSSGAPTVPTIPMVPVQAHAAETKRLRVADA